MSYIGGENLLKVITGEASKFYKKKKTKTERSKTMDKYAQLKRFHRYCQLQVYMYDFMYVDPEIIPVEYHFSASKYFVENYSKFSTPGPAPKHWLRFSYIFSEDYELDQNFYETSFLKNQTTHQTINLNYFTKIL